MSFSSDVKKELCRQYSAGRHCAIAEIAAMLNACGVFTKAPGTENNWSVSFNTENYDAANKYFTLIKENFRACPNISVKKHKPSKKGRLYCVLSSEKEAERILRATGMMLPSSDLAVKNIRPLIVKNECCKRAYIRGSFITGGSLSNPEKTYHLEFVSNNENLCRQLSQLINSFGLSSKVTGRQGHFIVYVKEGENIADLLNIMEAHRSLMTMENVRIIKDVRNNVNRMVNCETANITKTINAAVRQIQDITYISDTKGLGYLSEQLEEVARLRVQYDEATLAEIGAMLTPSVGKSGVNHRLRKISEIADNLRGDQ